MGLLDNVERGLERAVRGAFSRSNKVQPVEIANRIRREMDDKAMTLSAGRTLIPNVYEVLLSSEDFDRARSWGTPLAEELCDVVIRHAQSQGYTLQGPARVSFSQDDNVRPGSFDLASRTVKSDAAPMKPPSKAQPGERRRTGRPNNPPSASPRRPEPVAAPAAKPKRQEPVAAARPQRPERAKPQTAVLDVEGQRYALKASSLIIGRSSEADIMVDDTGVSRRHVEIRSDKGQFYAVDLGSTNGSYVNDQRLHGQTVLRDGSQIRIGRTIMTFRMVDSAGGR